MAAEDLRIRVVGADSLDRILGLWIASGADPTVTDSVEALQRLLNLDPKALLVAEIDGEPIGTVITGWDGWRGRLYRLVVHPEHRRRGVASRLVDAAELRLRDLGAIRIDAIVSDDDTAAARFWISAGYAGHDGRSRFVRNLER